MRKILLGIIALFQISAFANWDVSFDETSSKLSARNGDAQIEGELSFSSGKDKWTVAASRDGVANRLTLVDKKGDVQGYVVFPKNSDELQMLFYHRTAQAYMGELSFSGKIKFFPESFACRTKPAFGERVLPLGCNSPNSALNDSVFSPERDELLRLSAWNLSIKKDGSGYSFKMSGDIGEAAQAEFSFELVKNYFKNSYVPYYKPLNRKNCPKTPTGWMSWNTYFDKATAEDNLAEAKIGQKYLQPYGCEIWSIESWQGNSDSLPVSKFYNMNLEVNQKQFPEGMKKLAQDIRKPGFRPGIWMAPFGTGNKEFYETHKDWFLHDKEGNPVKSWNGIYTLDPTVPEAREHLKKIFETASKDWGYEFFKIDGMSGRNKGYCAHLYERPEIRAQFKDPSVKNPFELCVKAFREGIGERAIFLACQGHTSGAEAAYAEMARTGADIVHPNEPVKWGNVLLQARCTINQIFTHNISMIADPDTVLVKDLPLEQARVSCTVVALPAQLTFFGDRLAELDASQMKMLQQTLPPAFVRPLSLYPYFSMLPVWNLAVNSPVLGEYNVVAFFNWGDEDAEISATPEELGICPKSDYVGFEFWTQKPLGKLSKPFSQKVPARGVRLVVISKEKKFPQWIGNDRRIAQTAEELNEFKWDAAAKTLKCNASVINNFPLDIFVNVPQGFAFDSAVCASAECKVSPAENGAIKITLSRPDGNGSSLADFELKFK